MSLRRSRRRRIGRVGGSIFLSTCLLTLDFLGVLALTAEGAADLGGRFPFYLLTGAVCFVASLFYIEGRLSNGGQVIVAATGSGLVSLVGVGLAVEGIILAVTSPSTVLTESLIVYFLSAGLICTGLGFWTLNHWREYVGAGPR